MNTEADFLLTVAELAVAFAGFSTLVAVVGHRFSDVPSALFVSRLVGMLRESLMTIAFSLFPYLPQAAGASGESLWRLSSAAFGAAWLIYYVSLMRSMYAEGSIPDHSRVDRLYLFLLHPVLILVLLLSAMGVWGELVGLAYLTAISFLLFFCGHLFLQLVLLLAIENPDA